MENLPNSKIEDTINNFHGFKENLDITNDFKKNYKKEIDSYTKTDKNFLNLKKRKTFLKIINNFELNKLKSSEPIKNIDIRNSEVHFNTEGQEFTKNYTQKNFLRSLNISELSINNFSKKNQKKFYFNKNNKNNKDNLFNSIIDLQKIERLKNLTKNIKNRLKKENNSRFFKIKKYFETILDNNIYILFMTIVTIFIIFINDIQNAYLDPDFDISIQIIQTFIACLYFLEIIITCLCKDNYLSSFFSWLDIITTLYIVADTFVIFDIFNFRFDDE